LALLNRKLAPHLSVCRSVAACATARGGRAESLARLWQSVPATRYDFRNGELDPRIGVEGGGDAHETPSGGPSGKVFLAESAH
jgi:hypothetical protein